MEITKEKIRIEMEIEFENESGFEDSLDQAVLKIKDGYREGFDSNENENYYFKIIHLPS